MSTSTDFPALLRLGIAGVALLSLSACTSTTPTDAESPSPPAASVPSSSGSEDGANEEDQAWAQALRRAPSLQDTDRPVVEMVRYIEIADFGKVMVDCLNEAGFPDVALTADGEGYSTQAGDAAQAEALALAEYTCKTQFPVDPRFLEPLTEAQIRMIYDYSVGPLTDCLEAQGHVISNPPAFEVFRDQYPQGRSWSPIDDATAALSSQESIELIKICPQLPEGLYG
ncbi:hypothetical protein [Microbacterium marinilacus]|uniref:hypothetical protein n=1 Tax=Microbacterium marinilacus TaxID=415209 RepID=UPI001C8EA85B|nr:hypothetical protein [Microbacterium marinilacus]